MFIYDVRLNLIKITYMIEKILKSSHIFLLSIFLTTSIFFSGASQINSSQMVNLDSAENTLAKGIEDSSKMIDSPKISEAPDLGDDQAFPFIPGFGKNSGKD